MSDLEKQLRELAPARAPQEWRTEILDRAQRQAAPPEEEKESWLVELLCLLYPGRTLTTGLVLVWAVIFLLRVQTPTSTYSSTVPFSAEAYRLAQEERRWIIVVATLGYDPRDTGQFSAPLPPSPRRKES
jgi:hypothetical protein